MFEKYPFFSIGLFAAIASVTFHLISLPFIGQLFFIVIPILIITKVFIYFFVGSIEHPITKFCVINIFLYLVFSIVEKLVAWHSKFMLGALGMISGLCLILAAIGFLARVFMMIFGKQKMN